MKTINAFILAAGFGKRLSPITDHIPKPLLPILGRPILESILERISVLPIKQIGINMHHKWEMLRAWIEASPYSEKIRLFLEKPILGTGGAIKNAEALLQGSVFIVHNSDIVSDINLESFIDMHLSSGNTATLAVHDYKKFNYVWVDNNGRLKLIGKNCPESNWGLKRVAFTGIAAYSPEFLKFLPGGISSIVDAWQKAAAEGSRIGTVDFTGCLWGDIGTPDAFSRAIFDTLKGDGETIYVHSSVDCSGVDIGGYAVIEKGSLPGRQSHLRNCILLPGATVVEGSYLENALVGPDYIIEIEEPLELPPVILTSPWLAGFLDNASEKIAITLIGGGGSDRRYYRIRYGEKTAVLLDSPADDPDYDRQIEYTKFFRKNSLPVPELLGTDAENGLVQPWITIGEGRFKLALFEDLGDISLYSRLKFTRGSERIEKLYKKVLDLLVNLHTLITENVSECPLLKSRTFDYEHLRWETNYFIERFVRGLKGIDIQEQGLLDMEFDCLAREVDSFKKSIVHRDFQSQNIMITRGDLPRVIDYQGARIGPPAYDLASILWDPYVELEDDMRAGLINYYLEKMKGYFSNTFDEKEFGNTILPCRLQRHMQALGAYGFLSRIKGKTYFQKYIPPALQFLRGEIELLQTEYPALYGLIKKISEKTQY